MTTRYSGSSIQSTSILRDDNEVYSYVLRVAVLSDTLNLSITNSTNSSTTITTTNSNNLSVPNASTSSQPPIIRNHTTSSFRPAEGWTNALSSLGDIFKDSTGVGGNKVNIKFPKEFVKILDQRMETVAKGADKTYSDPLLRQTIGAFYGTYAQVQFQKKMRENRKIEELIMMFVTTASSVLKKRLEGDEWKEKLNEQVGSFVGMIRDCLLSKELVRNVQPELLKRLETYCEKLIEPSPSSSGIQGGRTLSTTVSDPGRRSSVVGLPSSSSSPLNSSPSSSSRTTPSTLGEPRIIPGMATNIEEMPLVKAVGNLFGKSAGELTKDVISIRRLCTERAAFNDLKICINNVAKGANFPARREEFDSDEAFQSWKKQESTELQELLLAMINRNPELVKSTPSEFPPSSSSSSNNNHNSLSRISTNGSISNRSSMIGASSSSETGSIRSSFDEESTLSSSVLPDAALYFVPPDPKYFYKRLFEIALDHDYEAMKDLPPDEDVSLTILSSIHEELLSNCAVRWRIMVTLKSCTFLNLICQLYKHQGVPEACVVEAMSGLSRVADSWNYWRWPWLDRQFLFKSLSALFDILLTRFFEIFQGILDIPFEEVVSLLEIVHSNEIFSEDIRDLSIILDELSQGMSKFVGFAYEEKFSDVDCQENRPHDLYPFLVMLDWIRSETKGYDRQFPVRVVGAIDVPAIFIGVAAPEFVKHLAASQSALLAAAAQAEGAANDADLLDLYRGVIELQNMHNAYCVDTPLIVDFSAWFEPYVRRWLATTDTKTTEWVKLAIAHDKFEPEGLDRHSSSIVDLIDSCKSATDFIIKLKWPNEYENARYLTGLSQTVAKSIEQYSNQLETLFLEEMFPRKPEEIIDHDVARPSAWLTKAKLVVQGDRKVEPFVFQPQSCVKLNNIQAARKLLDTMYTTLNADEVSRIVEANAPPVSNHQIGPPRFLFTVKIVLGENFVGSDGTPRTKLDPFLILSDSNGNRVAKTRTLYETNDPRWEETIDVSVKGDLWLRATVYNRNLVDHHDMVACAYVHLDPNEFGDFLARDIWLRLEDSSRKPLDSRLLLRISMEGEKDDIQFYFGRAFRSLKRAENDMTRTMVDKMSPFVRHYLSQNTLKALVKTSFKLDIDLDKVRGDITKVSGKLNAYVRDALNSNNNGNLIPPVYDEFNPAPVPLVKEGSRKKGKGPLTDQEIEDAIGDLFDYFNETFGTLQENLSQEAWDLVISRLWKDILSTIEALIVPPLSDKPTEMRLLSEKEIDIVFKWLGFLTNFFHAGGEGVPLEDLRNAKYRELIEARMFYDWSTDSLMLEAVKSMQRILLSKSETGLGRSKSVYQQRNLGTIRARKIEKKQSHSTSGEMILRILRMHPGTGDFLNQQIETQLRVQTEMAKQSRASSIQRRTIPVARSSRPAMNGRSHSRIPAVPSLPPIPDQS